MLKTLRTTGLVLLVTTGSHLMAEDRHAVAEAAQAAFARMPQTEIVPVMAGNCGADVSVHPNVAYCTSRNVVLVNDDGITASARDYFMAHAFGHAVQVQHGVADVALRAIRSRPEDEAKLRGYVERQVDCIAGFILAAAGRPQPDLEDLFDRDPLDVPHWGRDPLSRGPHLEVPVSERAAWLVQGYENGLSSCAVGEFPADLLLSALRR